METVLLFRFVVAAIYLIASVAYILLLVSGKKKARLPTRLFLLGLAAHLGEVVMRGAEAGAAGGAPFASLSGFLSLFALLLGFTYIGLERGYRVYSLGAFHIPVVFVIHLWSAILRGPLGPIPELRQGPYFVFHVVPAIFAYAALTAGSVAGIAYLLLERQIKSKKRGVLLRGLPNLDLVEKVNAAAVTIGAPLLALGAVVGIIQGHVALGQNFHWDPKVWVTLSIIGIFIGQLCLRHFAGWFGKRSVLISLLGFIALVVGVTIVNIYFSDLHGFDR